MKRKKLHVSLSNFAEDVLGYLLTQGQQKMGGSEFTHRTFLEYFTASHLVRINVPEDLRDILCRLLRGVGRCSTAQIQDKQKVLEMVLTTVVNTLVELKTKRRNAYYLLLHDV